MPPLARVVQEDGKLLIQAVLEVRSTALHIYMSHHLKRFIISLMQSCHTSNFCPSYCNYLPVVEFFPQGIGGGASRSLMDQFAEVLFSLNKHCFSLLAVWLKEALQPPGFPSSRVTIEQKDNFSQQILR